MKIKLASFIILLLLQSCLSTARLSDFPDKADAIDFDRYSSEASKNNETLRTIETSNEYYLEISRIIDEDTLLILCQKALKQKGHRVFLVDKESNKILAKRGLKANEWNSKTGIYYKFNTERNITQIYLNTRITQDATGGWQENRAKKIGVILEELIKEQ